MTTRKSESQNPFGLEIPGPMTEWWTQQWMQGINPMTRIQLAWMQSLSEVMQQEARFLIAVADASQRLAECYNTHEGDLDKMRTCYQDIAREMSDHHMERMKKVAELPNDFRERIWEEI